MDVDLVLLTQRISECGGYRLVTGDYQSLLDQRRNRDEVILAAYRSHANALCTATVLHAGKLERLKSEKEFYGYFAIPKTSELVQLNGEECAER